MNAQEMLAYALEEVKKLEQDEDFLAKDLFKGYEWKRIKLNDRLLFGHILMDKFKSMQDEIEILEKTSSGQQRYRKK